MIIAVPKEFVAGEARVALVPESVTRLKKLGFTIRVESGAGGRAGFLDEVYRSHGAELVDQAAELYAAADVLLKVQKPDLHPSGKHELEMLRKGALLIGFFYPLTSHDLVRKAATQGVDVIAMDAIPRITKAQRMDALSSQTNLAGYKAVLIAANAMGKIFPLMMTAAGTIAPGRVVIMGAGVAGLQAIATAKRLGAVVEVSDVRPEVKEQVESLGGRYIDVPSDENLSGEGGYAKEASADFLRKQQAVLEERLSEADAVITTALIPGRRAPVLITAEDEARGRDRGHGRGAGRQLRIEPPQRNGNCERGQHHRSGEPAVNAGTQRKRALFKKPVQSDRLSQQERRTHSESGRRNRAGSIDRA